MPGSRLVSFGQTSWLVPALAGLLLTGLFSPAISDSDFWWHLKTGQYIQDHRGLPVPDPFAFTTTGAKPAYAGEEITRHFNLTHEWLAQSLLYGIYRMAGFPGVVLARALLLTAFCGLAALIAYRRSGGLYRSLAAAMATAAAVTPFAVDRPFLVTFVLLAATLAIFEFRRFLWALPVIFLAWANCHGGFFLGLVAAAAYSAEAWLRKEPDRRQVWIWSAAATIISGLNPNGYRIFEILVFYRNSFLTSRLLEWARPPLWPPSLFSVLLVGGAAVLVWARRRVRPVDWILFAAFSGAGLTAYRNVPLIGLWAPIVIVAYLPWKRPVWRWGGLAVPAAAAVALAIGVARGDFFQLRAAEWKYPSGAADFLLTHHVAEPIFNTYEFGGYLIWRLWPEDRVFIDGRALSESLFMDYIRILYNHDGSDGQASAAQLLDRYGVQAIVMNGFEYNNGLSYTLAPALADPSQTAWKLVYQDAQSMVFMRKPPVSVEPLPSLRVLDGLEAQCDLHIQHEPQLPRCARALGQIFAKIGDYPRARRWIGVYLDHPHDPDPQAEEAYRKMSGGGG